MSLQSKADWLLQQAVDEGGVPGVVAMATDRSDTIYAGGWGERIAGTGIAMTPDTVGWIASMTKALTAACAMQLVEQGKLDLDGPAAMVVPDLAKAVVLEGFAADGIHGDGLFGGRRHASFPAVSFGSRFRLDPGLQGEGRRRRRPHLDLRGMFSPLPRQFSGRRVR